MGDVDAESVDAAVEPEPQHVVVLIAHFRIAPVEIRLARREPKMAGRYLELTRAMVAEALGASRLNDAELNTLLDRQAERTGVQHRLAALTTEAGTVKDRAGLLRLARNLYEWRTEMISERR